MKKKKKKREEDLWCMLFQITQITVTDVAVWLSCYVYIFPTTTYLTIVNPLKIVFSTNYVSLERSPLDEAIKSIRPLKK